MTHGVRLAMAIVGGAALTAVAGAGALGQGRGACRADVEKYCKDVERGEGRIHACLEQHLADLSPECQEKLRKKGQGSRKACKAEVEKFCKDVQRGKGRVRDCLAQHQAELSEGCRASLPTPRPTASK